MKASNTHRNDWWMFSRHALFRQLRVECLYDPFYTHFKLHIYWEMEDIANGKRGAKTFAILHVRVVKRETFLNFVNRKKVNLDAYGTAIKRL